MFKSEYVAHELFNSKNNTKFIHMSIEQFVAMDYYGLRKLEV